MLGFQIFFGVHLYYITGYEFTINRKTGSIPFTGRATMGLFVFENPIFLFFTNPLRGVFPEQLQVDDVVYQLVLNR